MSPLRWIRRLCVLALVVAGGCRSIAGFPPRPDADVAGDGDADADADVDADADADTDSDLDSDGEGGDATDADPVGAVVDMIINEVPAGTQAAGTSIVVRPVATCQPAGLVGLHVRFHAPNALVSEEDVASLADTPLDLVTGPGCTLPAFRITFPIAVRPYEVQIRWRYGEGTPWTYVDGVVIEVVPYVALAEKAVVGAPDATAMLPSGLKAEFVVNAGVCTGDTVDQYFDAASSLNLGDGELGSILAVACYGVARFYGLADDTPSFLGDWVHAVEEDADGPDRLGEIVYVPADLGIGDQLLVAAPEDGHTGPAGGGLYRFDFDAGGVMATRLFQASLNDGIEAVTLTDFVDPGLYWSNFGYIVYVDLSSGTPVLENWSELQGYRPYANSIAVGATSIYGDYAMFIRRTTEESGYRDAIIDRVSALGSGYEFTNLGPVRAQLEAPQGGFYGRYVYVIGGRRVDLVSPDGSLAEVVSLDTGTIVDGAFSLPRFRANHYAAGLYLLVTDLGSLSGNSVVRIVQDVSAAL